jgi:hypothetical protein
VLLFELFPAFVMIVGFVTAIALFFADRSARATDDSGWTDDRRPKTED